MLATPPLAAPSSVGATGIPVVANVASIVGTAVTDWMTPPATFTQLVPSDVRML
jgi:hypothetical protein